MDASRRSKIRFVDIGGGYWPPAGEWLQPAGTPEGMRMAALGKSFPEDGRHFFQAARPIDVFAGELGRAVNEHIFPHVRCRICFEPGRWICHNAMHLVMTVIDKKAQDLVITDAGTNAVGWERFESDYFPVLNLTRPSLKEITCDVLGSLCTPHDVWGNACWGEGIEPGDVLMIPTQGAYTYSLRQHFIKPLPSVVTIALQ
jgi:diaminopimelate decarboxylase